MQALASLLAGLIFGIGLIISGMANPAKVKNFLDLAGSWDPSLAFVMCGGVFITALGYWLTFQRSSPLLNPTFHRPTATAIDTRLLSGSALFGIGWGLTGFCPGPALVALPLLATGTLAFVPAMLAGVVLARLQSQPQPTIETTSPAQS